MEIFVSGVMNVENGFTIFGLGLKRSTCITCLNLCSVVLYHWKRKYTSSKVLKFCFITITSDLSLISQIHAAVNQQYIQFFMLIEAHMVHLLSAGFSCYEWLYFVIDFFGFFLGVVLFVARCLDLVYSLQWGGAMQRGEGGHWGGDAMVVGGGGIGSDREGFRFTMMGMR